MGFSPWAQRVFIMKMFCSTYLYVCKHNNTKKRETRKSQWLKMLSDTCLKGIKDRGISLMVQWPRLNAPTQGAWVQSGN